MTLRPKGDPKLNVAKRDNNAAKCATSDVVQTILFRQEIVWEFSAWAPVSGPVIRQTQRLSKTAAKQRGEPAHADIALHGSG